MKRNKEQAKELLRRYFEAETSDAEERWLRAFLASEEAVGPEFDEARAVMSFLVVGRRRRPSRLSIGKMTAWAASFIAAISLGIGWLVFQERNECVAYVYGEKVTNTEIVMGHMQESLQEMKQAGAVDVASQLGTILNTLENEEAQ